MPSLNINNKEHQVDADENMPLLWVLRDKLNFTGTKFGCGVAACGACTVLIDGAATRSCVMPLAAVVGKRIETIEGVATTRWRALQTAWIDKQVPQCGYCQSGMIMSAIGLLATTPKPTREEVRAGITNLCRCGTYQRVEDAVLAAADALGNTTGSAK